MQFLEHSVLGLRAARHVLESPDHPARLTLFPMVHVADPGFYDRVAAEAMAQDLVVFEGVGGRAARALTRSYRWLPLRRLGLVVQPRLDPGSGPAELLRADLGAAEFDTVWRALPWPTRAGAAALTVGFGLWGRVAASRPWIARHLATDDLPDRDDAMLAGTPAERPMQILRDTRDRRLRETLAQALTRNADAPIRIAVVYGAAHMGAAVTELRARGAFRSVESTWLDAIRF